MLKALFCNGWNFGRTESKTFLARSEWDLVLFSKLGTFVISIWGKSFSATFSPVIIWTANNNEIFILMDGGSIWITHKYLQTKFILDFEILGRKQCDSIGI